MGELTLKVCSLPYTIRRALQGATQDHIADGTTLFLSGLASAANDARQDSDAQGLFDYFLDKLSPLRLAFVHIIEGATGGARDGVAFDYGSLRARFKRGNENGAWIGNNGYTRAMAMDAVENDRADMVAFGRPFISNPDLVNRLRLDEPLAASKQDLRLGCAPAQGPLSNLRLPLPRFSAWFTRPRDLASLANSHCDRNGCR